MLVLSFSSAHPSGVRTGPASSPGWCPWRAAAIGGGSGGSSANKLAAALDRAEAEAASFSCFLCRRGDGWEIGMGIQQGLAFWCSCVSEKAFRCWIWSICRYSSLGTSSAATFWRPPLLSAFFEARRAGGCGAVSPLNPLVEGRRLGVLALSLGCQLHSLFLPAMEPDGRQVHFSLASASPLIHSIWCWCGELSAPSGNVPGGGEIGSKLRRFLRKRTTLQLRSLDWGPFCNVQGPCCNFLFLMGLWTSCTEFPDLI
jgi:hypothetical protein